jgi:hypothetical protein
MKQLKSANQLYRESGSSLPFKTWLEREKEKGTFMYANGLQSKINEAIAENIGDAEARVNASPDVPTNTIFGLNKYAVITLGVVVVAAIGYGIYKRRK